VLGIAVGAAIADIGVSAVAAVERVGMKAVLAWQADGGGVAALVLAVVVAALSLWACWPFVRCVPGMPGRIRRLGLPFSSGRARRDTLPAPQPAEQAALPAGPVRRALPGRERAPAEAFAALPAEAAPGREVVAVARRPDTVPRPPRDPRQEPPWTSVPFAEPSAAASPPSGPGPRGLPAAPGRSLESA
jgi:hypothetical protein